jgi:hypothetical protein
MTLWQRQPIAFRSQKALAHSDFVKHITRARKLAENRRARNARSCFEFRDISKKFARHLQRPFKPSSCASSPFGSLLSW